MATLAAIEQETARRLGPYDEYTSNASSTQSLLVADDLVSSATPGDHADRYLLRRGLKSDGTAVAGFAATDRVRLVKLYDPDGAQGNGVAGSLLVDRPWTTAPVATEVVEEHALEPQRELRRAVLAGLERCYVMDRVSVALFGVAAERDLTAVLPWVTRAAQVYGAEYATVGAVDAPVPVPWYGAFEQGGHVYLGTGPDPFPYGLLVRALRPVSSVVNNKSAPATPVLTDVATGGALLANTTYYGAVAANGPFGLTPAAVPTVLLTAQDGANTHVVRFRIARVSGANSYPVYLSTATAPLLVATITEAQRAAGCTVTAQNTVTATTPGAGLVDIRLAGVGTAAVQAAPPANDADTVPVDASYGAAAACAAAWSLGSVRPRLVAVSAQRMTISQDDANAWLTREAAQRIPPPPDRWEMSTTLASWGPMQALGGRGWI